MPKVSVVVPTYNHGPFLPECLESILSQGYRDLEVIVVDDGSTDNTQEVLKPFLSSIRYYPQEHGGISPAYNRCLELSTGEYVAFVDADDALIWGSLEVRLSLLEANPRVGLVYGQVLDINEQGRVLGLRKPRFARGSYIREGQEELKDLLLASYLPTSAIMVRKQCFEEVGGFWPGVSSAEDWHMWIRVATRYPIAYMARPLAKRPIHLGNISHRQGLEEFERNHYLILDSLFRNGGATQAYYRYRARAYGTVHYKTAQLAYQRGKMGLARRHLNTAFRIHPRALTESRGLHWLGLWAKTFLPHRFVARWKARRLARGNPPRSLVGEEKA